MPLGIGAVEMKVGSEKLATGTDASGRKYA